MPSTTPVNFYDVLNVARDADGATIKAAYRKAARHAHPDSGGSADAFAQVHAAYETLSSPLTRREYDRSLNPQPMPDPAGSWGVDDPVAAASSTQPFQPPMPSAVFEAASALPTVYPPTNPPTGPWPTWLRVAAPVLSVATIAGGAWVGAAHRFGLLVVLMLMAAAGAARVWSASTFLRIASGVLQWGAAAPLLLSAVGSWGVDWAQQVAAIVPVVVLSEVLAIPRRHARRAAREAAAAHTAQLRAQHWQLLLDLRRWGTAVRVESPRDRDGTYVVTPLGSLERVRRFIHGHFPIGAWVVVDERGFVRAVSWDLAREAWEETQQAAA